MVALITSILVTIIVLVLMHSADATCSPGWKHYNGTCYMITNLTEDNLDSANSVCTESYQYSELLINKDIGNLADILSGTDDMDANKRYWVKCAQKQMNCWFDNHNSTWCISFSFQTKSGSYVPACSNAFVICRRSASVTNTFDVTNESLVNISTWIKSQTMFIQNSDPVAVFETCNDVLKGINENTSIEAIYRIIEECEDYAVATVQISEEGIGLYFKFEFLEVTINKSSNFFDGSFSYSSEEGDTFKLNLAEYSQEQGNHTSAVTLLFFKHKGLLNQFGKNDSTSLASNLMTASFAVDGAKISTPVNFSLDTKKSTTPKDEYRYVCAFWKNDLDKMYWSEYGCGTRNRGECSCNHTTSFGVLVQVTEISKKNERALSLITYIGCGFSLTALLITITILMCIPSLNSTRIAIHKNFVFSLIFAETVFLIGPLGKNRKVFCQVITLSMHYLWLAVFCWMLMEGLHLYLLVVKVYRSGKSYLRYYVATAWGCPFVIVAVSASLKWQDYKSDSICWLSWNNGMIWAFLAPAAVIVVVNLLILIRVVFVVVDAADDVNGTPSKVTQTKAAAKSAIVLAPILGTTWLIGVAANLHITGTYLFTIFNSLQGVFVFVFYCVRNSEVRNSIDRIRQKRALTKSNEKNTSSTDAKSKISNLTLNKVGSIDNI